MSRIRKLVRSVMLGVLGVLGIALGAAGGGCERGNPAVPRAPVAFSAAEISRIRRLSPLPPPPPDSTNAVAGDPQAALLGQRLFFDGRLSRDGSVACATCHDPASGLADGKPLSQGLGTTDRHSQALWNVAYQRWFFWDGRADSLWAQALQPLQDEREMGATPEHLLAAVAGHPTLNAEYTAVFGDPGGHSTDRFLSNLGKALAAYQQQLVSRDSPFDHFVAGIDSMTPGDDRHLDESARRGLRLFVGRGKCILCHTGPNFSDGEFHNIGLARHPQLPRDSGRFEGIRKLQADRFSGSGAFSDDTGAATNVKLRHLVVKMNNMAEFKTPTLRHVAETAPYMHDGRFATLRDVLDHYSELPGEPPLGHREETLQPLRLTGQEKSDLEAFLRSLTGAPLPQSLTQPPALPAP